MDKLMWHSGIGLIGHKEFFIMRTYPAMRIMITNGTVMLPFVLPAIKCVFMKII